MIRCLARLIRCAIVASGTRNARAISAVVRPPTARSVSAIAEAGVSDGWQHRNSTTSVSSRSGTSARRRLGQQRPASSRRRRDRSLRRWSISRRDAVWISQPRGLLRDPLRRPVRGRGEQRLLHGVLGGVEVAVPADEHAEDLRRQLAQQVLDVGRHAQRSPPASPCCQEASISSASDGAVVHHLPHLDRLLQRDAAGPGHRRHLRRDLDRPLLGLDVDDLVAGEPLLELLERAVGDHRRGRPSEVTILARSGPVRTVASTSSPFATSSRFSAP